MRMTRFAMGLLAAIIVAGVAGCSHKLVAPQGETAVSVFPDKATLQKLGNLKKQSGVIGKLGNLGESIVAKQVDSGTPVRIIASDPDGVQIEITDGPQKGLQGFVTPDSVN
jgi:predicted NAD/FAD-binding protein